MFRKNKGQMHIVKINLTAIHGINDPNFDFRMGGAKAAEARDQPAHRDRGNCGDNKGLTGIPRPVAGGFNLRQRSCQTPSQIGSMWQEPGSVALTLKQRFAQPILDIPDLMADGGLGDKQCLSSSAERPRASDRLEGAQGI